MSLHTCFDEAAEALVETLWPTRCAICDRPGEVLCDRCRRRLPYVDRWRACPLCGAPFGMVQCTECNDVMLAARGRASLPFKACRSAVAFTDETGSIVRVWKDSGEQRLAKVMAALMASVLEPEWLTHSPALVPVPATAAALRRRGFDHGLALAQELAKASGLPCAAVLGRPKNLDQRKLTRSQRASNTQGRFELRPQALAPATAIVVDDVYTTGSTICAASDALLRAGCERVFGVTFARV